MLFYLNILLVKSCPASRVRGVPQLTVSYIQGVGPAPLLGKTVGVVLEEAAERTPDRTAVVFSSINYRRTFQQLLADVCTVLYCIILNYTVDLDLIYSVRCSWDIVPVILRIFLRPKLKLKIITVI